MEIKNPDICFFKVPLAGQAYWWVGPEQHDSLPLPEGQLLISEPF